MSDKKENREKNDTGTTLDSSSTGSSDTEIYSKQFKTRHTIAKHGITGYNNDDLSIDTDMSDFLIDSKQDLSNKDIFISALQEQVKKMEEMYKKKLDDSQLLRLKFCRTAQELSDLKKICHVYEEENKNLREKVIASDVKITPVKHDEKNLEKEYEELLKKINAMENNTIAMKDILDIKITDLYKQEHQVYSADMNVNEMFSMYKNIETILNEHNQKFDILANKLNINYENQIVTKKFTSRTSQTTTTDGNNFIRINVERTNKMQMTEYEERKSVAEYLQKIQQLENTNAKLRDELELANKGKDSNFNELNKIQEKIQDGSKTLNLCLYELKLLKEENRENSEHQNALEQENKELNASIKELENALSANSEQLETVENEAKMCKEKEEDAMYCICELKKELEDKEKLHKEKRQKYRERISSISSSETILKLKLVDQQVLEKTIAELRMERDQINVELDDKNTTIATLQDEIKFIEKNEEEARTHMEIIIDDLTLKFEKSLKEIEEYKATIKELQDKNDNIVKENANLCECLKEANVQLEEYRETQESLQATLDSQKEMVNDEKERIENEIEDAQILSAYLNEQLNIAKMKYDELLPLTENCCCKHITEIIFWLHKQNETLKTAQSNLMQDLQNKLNEARKKNNVDTFTIVKDIINLMLESTYVDNNEMSNEMKIAFEKLMEKRKLLKETLNQENSETCTYSIMPDERSLNSQHSHNFSNNKIDVILEEAEEYIIEEVVGDNQDRIASNDIENKESETFIENERFSNDKMVTEESKFSSQSTPILSNENIQQNYDTSSLTRSISNTKLPRASPSTHTCFCNHLKNSRSDRINLNNTEYVHQYIHCPRRIVNDTPRYCPAYIQEIPYICLNSPIGSALNIQTTPVEEDEKASVVKDDLNDQMSSDAQDGSVESTSSEPILNNNDASEKYNTEATFSDSDLSEKCHIEECKKIMEAIKTPCKNCQDNIEQEKKKNSRRNNPRHSSDVSSGTKLDDYLNKLSKMEKKVGTVRMELRTSSVSRGRTKSNGSTKNASNNEKAKTAEKKHDYHARCFDPPDKPADPYAFNRKDYKKPRGNK